MAALRSVVRGLLFWGTLWGVSPALGGSADGPAIASPAESNPENWSLHGQSTFILQGQPGFNSPYAGANSLPSGDNLRDTFSIDLYFGFHPWAGSEFYANPEFFQGFGFADTHGIADFPNGEAYKVGSNYGKVIWPHIMFRQTIGLGGDQEKVEGDLLQMAGNVDVNRITFTIGRFAVFDHFDANSYAHDSRSQFMSWAMIDGGAFDYAADAYGYTQGTSIEWNTKNWAIRWGVFIAPRVSNGVDLDWNIFKQWQQILEFERRYTIDGHPGKVRLLGWLERAHMGSYADTLNDPALNLDITATERYRYQQGAVLGVEQEITQDLGSFLRLSWRDGHSEVWQFTDMDRALSLGLSLKGGSWNRDKDTAGLAWNLGGLSPSHEAFLAAGGLGPLIGDGRLNYGLESVAEAYYNAELFKGLHASLDYQLVCNPAYNQDRGPINIFSVRLHYEF